MTLRLAVAPPGFELGALRAGSDGAFDFGDRPAARYAVLASAPGHGSGAVVVDLRDPGASPQSTEVVVRLTACHPITGFVRDQDGRPLANVQISALEKRIGAARVGNSLRDGSFSVCAGFTTYFSLTGYATEEVGRTRPTVDLVMVRGASIAIAVVDTASRPVPDALVSVVAPGALSAMGGVTDAEGRLLVSDLAAGRVEISAEHPERGLSQGSIVEVGPGFSASILVVLSTTCRRVSGRVEFEGNAISGVRLSGAVSLADGSFIIPCLTESTITAENWEIENPGVLPAGVAPASGIVLRVRRGNVVRGKVVDGSGMSSGEYAVCDFERPTMPCAPVSATGAFAMQGLSDGTYALQAIERRTNRRSSVVAVEATSSRVTADVTLIFEGRASISGILVGSDGHGLAHAVVVAGPVEGTRTATWLARFNGKNTMFEHERLTDASGTFQIGGLSRGEFEIRSPSFSPSDGWPIIKSDGATEVRDVVLRVATSGSRLLRGFVTTSGGAPAPAARLSVGASFVSSEENGEFVLDVGAGSKLVNVLVITREGDSALFKGIDVEAERGRHVRFMVEDAGSLDVRVTGCEGTCEAEVVSPDGSSVYRADVASGSFSVDGLRPGDWVVIVRQAQGERGGSAIGNVVPGKRGVVDVRLGPLGAIRGRVLSFPAGTPDIGIACHVLGEQPELHRTDSQGTVLIGDVVPGTVDVVCADVLRVGDEAVGARAGHAAVQVTSEREVEFVIWTAERRGLPGALGFRTLVSAAGVLVVSSVDTGGPARSLSPGDAIFGIDGAALTSQMLETAGRYLDGLESGRVVELEVTHEGVKRAVTVVVGPGP